MRWARALVLLLAVGSAAGAAVVVRRAAPAAPRPLEAPQPLAEIRVLRHPIAAGEPLAEAKLIRPGDGSVIAALIAPGMRAIAIPMREESAAGGLIQPNDRVDVLWTRRAPEGSTDAGTSTRTLLRGAKVLAIGRSTDAKSRSNDGRTATLELTPEQAGTMASARASGEISLSLIPAADMAAITQAEAGATWDDEPGPGIKIMKFGRRTGLKGAR